MTHTIAYFPTNGCNPFTGYGKNEMGLMRGLMQAGVEFHNSAEIALVVGYAGWCEHPALRDKRIWLYTMSESDKVSPKWVNIINACCERVLVPTPSLVSIYQDSGVIVPVHWVGHGVDIHAPAYVKRDPNPATFNVLTYTMADPRKGGDVSILAFMRAFGNDPRYRLTLRVREKNTWLESHLDPRLRTVSGEISENEWNQLLAEAHCFLFPSRGEGWGMPPREAVLSGLPTIATQWLGMWDVDRWGWAVQVERMREAQFRDEEANARDARWAEPSQTQVEDHLKWIASNYAQALEKASQGREYLLREHSYAQFAQRIVALLDEHRVAPRQLNTVPYAVGSIRLNVRRGEYRDFDMGIAREVQSAYEWPALKGRQFASIIDVGAHIGSYSLYAAQRWPDAQIVAIEAEEENAALLAWNTQNVPTIHALHGVAVGDSARRDPIKAVRIAKARENSGGHLVLTDPDGFDDPRYTLVEAPAATWSIPAMIATFRLRGPILVKMDCEGAEFDCLVPLLAEPGCVQFVVGEYHSTEARFRNFVLAGGEWLLETRPLTPEMGVFLMRRKYGL